jgi:hypothetical protein
MTELYEIRINIKMEMILVYHISEGREGFPSLINIAGIARCGRHPRVITLVINPDSSRLTR